MRKLFIRHILSLKGFSCFILAVIFFRILLRLKEEYVHLIEFEESLKVRDMELADGDILNSLQTRDYPWWYFTTGKIFPKAKGKKLFRTQYTRDNILSYLLYLSDNKRWQMKKDVKLKTILLPQGLASWNVQAAEAEFVNSQCPINACTITANMDKIDADLIMHRDSYTNLYDDLKKRNFNSIHVYYTLESPYNTPEINPPDAINWTATYRSDSDIVAPYAKWVYYDKNIQRKKQPANYALNKSKKVAWFVSNCDTSNKRLNYAHELQKYIQVDIYGSCGNMTCPRSGNDFCLQKVQQEYKFYLAFENSNCQDYITEKLFENALNHNLLPIVMGGRPIDYKTMAPRKSYIHVDQFRSPKQLAEYLHELDKDDALYNSYFEWKGTGEFINTFFWCRLCAMLHDEENFKIPRWYSNINAWWRDYRICTARSSWKHAEWF